jgi:FimV-like protein
LKMKKISQVFWIILIISLPTYALSTDNPQTKQYGPVQANETLWSIANRLRPAGISTAQMVIAIQATNPKAFKQGNLNKLTAGYILQIPPLTEIRKTTATQATALFNQHLQNPAISQQPTENSTETEPANTPLPTEQQPSTQAIPEPPAKRSLPPETTTPPLINQTEKTSINNAPEEQTRTPWDYLISIILLGIFAWLVWRRHNPEQPYPLDNTAPIAPSTAQPTPTASIPNTPTPAPPQTSQTKKLTPDLAWEIQPEAPPATQTNVIDTQAPKNLDQPLPDLEAAFAELAEEEKDLTLNKQRQPPNIVNEPHDPIDDHIALAKAYKELGDIKSARELLEEAQQTGNPTQQQQANDLLANLGGALNQLK